MDDIDKAMEEYRLKKEAEEQAFLQKGLDKMTGELAYHSYLLLICERFKLNSRCYYTPEVAYILTDYFIENVDEPFDVWVRKNDAPFVRPLSDARKIFHEFKFLDDDIEILKLANKVYGLDLQTDFEKDFMYSFSFDFDSFTPIDITGVRELKTEISILEKHNVACDDLKEELMSFGLTEEQLELI